MENEQTKSCSPVIPFRKKEFHVYQLHTLEDLPFEDRVQLHWQVTTITSRQKKLSPYNSGQLHEVSAKYSELAQLSRTGEIEAFRQKHQELSLYVAQLYATNNPALSEAARDISKLGITLFPELGLRAKPLTHTQVRNVLSSRIIPN
jgi:hypothetical protein